MTFTTLVDPETLANLLGSYRVAVVDCRFELANPESGEAAYQVAHIPGAVFAHLDRDLSGPKTGTNGRHPLPSTEALTTTLGRLGIDDETQVIAYDQDTGMFASRLWWLLRWLGHDAVAVLDGGFARWTNEGRPTANGVETATTAHVHWRGAPGDDRVSSRGRFGWRPSPRRREGPGALSRRRRADRSGCGTHPGSRQLLLYAESRRRTIPNAW